MKRIGVLRALPGVGDMLCAVPALRAVRAAHPQAWITLLGLPSSRWFVDRFPHLLDELLVVEGVAGVPEVRPDPAAARRFEREARGRCFDLALQLHGSGMTSNAVLGRLGARQQVGARPAGMETPGFPGEAFIPYPDHLPEVGRLLAVAAASGCPSVGEQLELPLTAEEQRWAEDLARGLDGSSRDFACVHAGASRPDRCWAPAGFAAVADHLVAQGLPVVFTGGAENCGRAEAVRRAMQPKQAALPTDLTGGTTLGQLGALYRRARLVVTNDTGASHVAAAVRAPSVVVGAPEEPLRWAPRHRLRHRYVTGPTPATWPAVGAVLDAVDQQLARSEVSTRRVSA